jgi:hypothetical protein
LSNAVQSQSALQRLQLRHNLGFQSGICEKLKEQIFAWAAPVRAPENLIQPLFDPARGADTLLRPNFRNP